MIPVCLVFPTFKTPNLDIMHKLKSHLITLTNKETLPDTQSIVVNALNL